MSEIKLGIIGAMDSEVQALRDALADAREFSFAGMCFRAGRLLGLDAVVVKCGIGKVNAAMCVQLLCDHFHVTHIINTGVAGALDDRLEIGDIVISAEAVQHDFDLSPIGVPRGVIPPHEDAAIAADAALLACAERAAASAVPELGVYRGRICSGDQFIAGSAAKRRITDAFGGLCAEMEGAAVAQACDANGVPFVILRAISDRADDSGGVSFAEFEAAAAQHCVAIVMHTAALLGE